MATFINKKSLKKPVNFTCELCDFKCSYKKDYSRHVETKKHKNNILSTNSNKFYLKNPEKILFQCEKCEKSFKERTGLWRHKKNCKTLENENCENNSLGNNVVIELLKQNSELQKKLLDMAKDRPIINNNCNNTTNNAFNLNVYLNDTCKNAMNIQDFVSSIKLNMDDLKNFATLGYIENITSIILKSMNSLEHCVRPVHCSDIKREVLYIKDNDKWEKEGSEKQLLTKAIKQISNENINQIRIWRDSNPECLDPSSNKNNLYLKIMTNSFSGVCSEESGKNINKIISNVAKEVVIDKANI